MEIGSGVKLLHYRLVEKIGEGGMGVVWKARDEKLRRDVALKVLPAERMRDPEHRKLMVREARAAAAVSHPNIATIHEINEAGDVTFIAMELVRGKSLRMLIAERVHSILEILDIAIGISKGLAHAHQNRIVHRDLKPANVIVGSDRHVKILDFGLAKVFQEPSVTESQLSQFETEEMSHRGLVLGTAAYMSPEQAAGGRVDTRSDVFSFGIILYELIAGKRPFRGGTTRSTLAKIQEAEPEPISELRNDLPPELERIVQRCLRKDPEERYNDTRDLLAALRDLRGETSSGAVAPTARVSGRPSRLVWGLMGAMLIGAISLVLALWPETPVPARPPHQRQVTFSGLTRYATLSPDGQLVAYAEQTSASEATLVVQDLAGGEPLRIFDVDYFPSEFGWLPDSRQLLVSAVLRGTPQEGGIYLLHRFGGTPQRVSEEGWLFCLSPDGTRFPTMHPSAPRTFRIMHMTEGEELAFDLDDSVVWPSSGDWSPTGEWIALGASDRHNKHAIWLLSTDGAIQNKIVGGIPGTDPFTGYAVTPRWLPGGNALYYMQSQGSTSDLMKVRIDHVRGERISDPSVVFAGLESLNGRFTLSVDGLKLAYDRETGYSNIRVLSADETGRMRPRPVTSGTFYDLDPAVSPDGKSVAFSRSGEIFVVPIEGGQQRQITFLKATSRSPVWSPDGNEIAFVSDAEDGVRVWRTAISGGNTTPFEASQASTYHNIAWAPGSRILYQRPGNRNFHLLDPATGRETPFIENDDAGWIFQPSYSPDGSRVAVNWNRDEAGVWVVSLADGSQKLVAPRGEVKGWSDDGKAVVVWRLRSLQRIRIEDGRVEKLFGWPFDQELQGECMPADQDAICTVQQVKADIWLLEDFDPEVN